MRLRSVVIFGIGYVVGTRAGRDRFEQIAASVRGVAESDVVRGYADRAFDMARGPFAMLGDTADDTSVEAGAEDASEDSGDNSDRSDTANRTRSRRSR